MKNVFAIAILLLVTRPVVAETVKEIRGQLEAQQQINELLKQRIETLEAELAGRNLHPSARAVANGPDIDGDDPESDRALERALGRRGSSVLAPFVLEVSPSFFWSHTGSDSNATNDDIYGVGVDARIGLPGGWMIGARIPYLQRDAGDSGNNTGIGDVSTSLWKSLVSGKGSQPSLVASLQYIAPTGEDAGDADVPLGVGFRQLTARVSALETIAPVALFGDLYYTHYISETISGINLNRDGAIGFGLGASLAVRPDVSLTGGVDFTFEDELELDGVTLDGTDTVLGRLELGVGVLLSRYVFLNVFGTFGITDDSPDLTVGMALPIRF